MRVFVTGATGALGQHLVPGLVAAGHEVTATTRTPGKAGQLRAAGAAPVVLDGLDRPAVLAAVRAAAPQVIVHQMTALADMRSLRNTDRVFAVTNELRTRGTDNLLAAAAEAGTRCCPTAPVAPVTKTRMVFSSRVVPFPPRQGTTRSCDTRKSCPSARERVRAL